jgi:A/G-specific adenine glycosylase
MRRKALLLHRTGQDARRLAGLHELPTAEQLGLAPSDVRRLPLLARRTRTITRFQISESIHAVAPRRGLKTHGPGRDGDLVWVPLARLDSVTLSGPHRRWVSEILSRQAAEETAAVG